MKAILAPSILSADFANLANAIQQLDSADCDWIHLDIMDGNFVPPITFGAQAVAALRLLTNKPFDCHLMINHPETQIEAFREAGVDRLTVHVEACPHLHRVLQNIREAGMLAGVAINPATPVIAIAEVLELVDLVLVMTVNPGWGGQKFIPECLHKMRQIREWTKHHHIEADGGVDPHTAPQCTAAGANVLVAGSYTFSGEPSERLAALRRAVCDAPVS